MRMDVIRKKPARRAAAFFMSFVLACSFAGCGKREVVYNIEELEDSGGEGNTSEGNTIAYDLKESLGLDESSWSASFVSGDGKYDYTINASISVPEGGHMSVLELEKRTFTAEFKKEILEEICDADTIYVYSEEDLPAWYIDSRLPELENEQTEYLELFQSITGSDVMIPDEYAEPYQELLNELNTLYSVQGSSAGIGITTMDYSEDVYFGDINGQHYYFTFEDDVFSCNIADISVLSDEKGKDSTQLSCFSSQTDIEQYNLCSLSPDELEKQAADIMNRMGLDEYRVYNTNALCWCASPDDELWYDGYSYIYTREVDGVPVDYTDYDGLALIYAPQKADSKMEYGVEHICVQMNEKGLISLETRYLYDIKETLVEQVSLLPFESIQKLIGNCLLTGPNPYVLAEYPNYTELKLIYLPTTDHKNGYVLLPVWRLSYGSDNQIMNILCINAIDGSVIDILDAL